MKVELHLDGIVLVSETDIDKELLVKIQRQGPKILSSGVSTVTNPDGSMIKHIFIGGGER